MLLLPAPASAVTTAAGARGCDDTYTKAMFHAAARSAFRRAPYTSHERRQLRKFIRCQRVVTTSRRHRSVRWHLRRYKRSYYHRQATARYTPYDCGSAGHWAIPCGIIACESGFSWSAYNPSGALGPYQLLGKGAPWPVRTAADRIAHHRIAFRLYAGGAGRHHWVC